MSAMRMTNHRALGPHPVASGHVRGVAESGSAADRSFARPVTLGNPRGAYRGRIDTETGRRTARALHAGSAPALDDRILPMVMAGRRGREPRESVTPRSLTRRANRGCPAQPGTRFLLMAGGPYGETPVYNGPYVD
jgi:hypothetical protein